jgi:arylsulfatase A-like enzyme
VETICRAQGIDYPSTMPRLSKLAADNLAWTQFVSQQRQTNRGLYTIMTGSYPQLDNSAPRMTDYVAEPSRPALPAVLREAGYETVFLQAADLDYMQKGKFMQSAGFNRVLGNESFQACRFRTHWGPDDLSVMDKGYELVQELRQQGKPWFLTVFTAGTHHPYEVPGDFRSAFKPGTFAHAAAYADAAVASLVARLEHDEALADTLVLITSDESSGMLQAASDVDCEVSQNWGFLVALTPEGVRRRVTEPFMQSDLALSIVDYLGLGARPHRFVGRSAFRAYDRPRPIFCGNVYFGSVTLFDTDGSLYICPYDFHAGRRYRVQQGRLFGGGKSPQTWDNAETSFMLAMVRYSLRRGACRSLAERPKTTLTY